MAFRSFTPRVPRASPWTGSRAGPSGGREIDDRVYPVEIGPSLGGLASTHHEITPTAQNPCLGTAIQAWDVVASAAAAQLAIIVLTRGLYRITWGSQTNDPAAAVRRVDIDVLNRAGTIVARANGFCTPAQSFSGAMVVWIDEEREFRSGTAGSRPAVRVVNIDAQAAGTNQIGWLNVVRLWTDRKDPGE